MIPASFSFEDAYDGFRFSQFFKNTSETLGEVKTLYEEVILASTKVKKNSQGLQTLENLLFSAPY